MHPGEIKPRVLVPHHISPQRPPAAANVHLLQGRSMGCDWSVHCVLDSPDGLTTLRAEVQSTLDRVVMQMSTWEQASNITCFNNAAAGTWHELPPEFESVLDCALRAAELSRGACDPTAGALVDLWGFGAQSRYNQPGFKPPTDAAIASALRSCDWQRLEVDHEQHRIYQNGQLRLDLSAVAKGFGVDEVSRCLSAHGVVHHLVDVGGELRGMGVRPDGQPWWVEVQLPHADAGLPPTRVALHGLAIATSGDYLRCYDASGQHYCHCIDPRIGRPIQNGVASVTVLHPECMAADAWSTALMVLGPLDGLALAESQQLAAYFIVNEGDRLIEKISGAMSAMVH
jgi:thiamine biosynthesis lipoprotein